MSNFLTWILVVSIIEHAGGARETHRALSAVDLSYLELSSQDFQPQRLDDGYMEVIGLTSATLVSKKR